MQTRLLASSRNNISTTSLVANLDCSNAVENISIVFGQSHYNIAVERQHLINTDYLTVINSNIAVERQHLLNTDYLTVINSNTAVERQQKNS